jgi:hypothetical protein
MGSVLDRYSLEIVEVVLEVTMPLETRRLMGAVLKARFSIFPASLSEAQTVAKADSIIATDGMRSSGLDRAAAVVRSLLATAENVHAWSHACLEHLIRITMELRPSTLIKSGIGRSSREMFENSESRKDYLPQYTGPPSWVEEQRMIKAFWRLQFFLELHGAGSQGHLGTYWPRREVDVLSQRSADGFYDLSNGQREQILTACDFLDAVISGAITSVEAVHDNAYNLPTIRWVEGTVSRCSCAEPLSIERDKDTFRQGPEHLDQTPMGYRFYSRMSSDQWLDGWPPLLGFPFQPWRKFGFAIWDDKRMVDLGMLHTKNPFKRHPTHSFRWFSILHEEDLP